MAALQHKLTVERFGLQRFGNNDTLINFYTGFPSYQQLITFFKWIEPSANSMRTSAYQSTDTISLAGRPRCMILVDELFMFLIRLRLGLYEQDLAVRFNCTVSTVSRKVIVWANYLYFVLGAIPIWLSRKQIDRLMPEGFRKLYPSTRVIIDCTEIKTEQPSSLVLNSQLYSSYKGTTTFKCLIGCSPHGAVTFVSNLYTGTMSDVEITTFCGIVDLLEQGDSVMADKGFTVENLLKKKGVALNIPPFLEDKGQFSTEEIEKTETIASLRIHVERVIRRIKEHHLFDSVIPMTMVGSINQVWAVACMLSNFRGPML